MAINLATTSQCTGCGACRDVCPKHAIQMKYDDEGFQRPHIDSSLCVECGLCQCSCPVLAPTIDIKPPLACYAAKCKNDELRLASSSGGIFSVLALDVLHREGVVYGCAFDENFNAHHIRVTNEKDLAKLRGSKYMQSNLEDCFSLCREDLINGTQVLFSGTPCQIAGLLSYLKRDFANLTTVEILCHGVPSVFVWQTYLKQLHFPIFQNRGCIISFREKSVSWRRIFLSIKKDTFEIYEPAKENIFYKIFLKNLCLRPCCYDCAFKAGKSGADFTIGDFWGIENVCPELDDDKGTSAVVVHSAKGIKIWKEYENSLDEVECSIEDISKKNMYFRSSECHPKRNYFMKKFRKISLKKLFICCIYGPWYVRFARKIYKCLVKK